MNALTRGVCGSVVLAGCLASTTPVIAGQTPAPAAPAAAPSSGVDLLAEGTTEAWRLDVTPLPARNGLPPSHAVILAAVLATCDTPRAFPMAFQVGDAPEIRKQAALLSRQRETDGGCVDAVATVFPQGTAPSFSKATTVTITIPNRRFVLSAAHIGYLAKAFAVRAADEDGATTSTLTQKAPPLPEDPAARAAASEARALNERAVQLFAAGRLKEARRASEAAVGAGEKAYGPDHAEVGSLLVNLGLIARKLGDNKAAVGYYLRAVGILEKNGPSEGLGVVLDNLGRALESEKDLDGAVAATTRAIEVLSAALGSDDQHVGYAINNLALLQSAKGDHAQAAETCDRGIAILTRALGPGHPDLKPFLEDQRELRLRASR
jgi:hypothetical protein